MFQKSDAKIEITITTKNLIRIKYSPSSFNYRLSGANFANFKKIHRTIFEQQDLSQLIVQFLGNLRFSHLFFGGGGGLGTTYDIHLGLIAKRVVDFLLVLLNFFAGCYG